MYTQMYLYILSVLRYAKAGLLHIVGSFSFSYKYEINYSELASLYFLLKC